jgi:hypothetical protein
MSFNQLVGWFWMQDQITKLLVPLPSLVLELLARPSHPLLVLEVRSGTKFQLFMLFNIIGPFLGLTRKLGACQFWGMWISFEIHWISLIKI